MTAVSLLMCRPEYFDVVYEINPWMHVKKKVDKDLAMAQWTAYYELLTKKLNVRVELIEPVLGLPDMVFTANAGMVYKNMFIRSNFRHKERRGEEQFFEKWFKKHKYAYKMIEQPFRFEGEGDALWLGKEFFTGFHFRSDVEAHDIIAGLLRVNYFALELCDKRFYHLDTCFMPLNDKSALVFLPAFETYAQLILLESIPDPIKVPQDEALRFACNALVAGQDVVLPKDCPKTTRELEKRGFRVHNLDFSEFIKAGGAAKCLALKI